jgi:DMSO/TMAO reductase YedYZ heme-binding membrane subunit
MIRLNKYIRVICLACTFTIIIGIYFYLLTTINSNSLLTIRLTQTYGFCALAYLYLALLQSPLYSAFPNLPGNSLWRRARRSLGVSAWIFAILHSSNAFFFQLGGFPGLAFLGSAYIIPILYSFTALVILTLMAGTSFDFIIRKMGPNWKRLHRLVYLAGIFILVHSLLLGSHFENINEAIPVFVYSLVFFLLILEGMRFDKYIQKWRQVSSTFTFIFPIWCVLLLSLLGYLYIPRTGAKSDSFNVHAQHEKMAEEIYNETKTTSMAPQPHNTKRYSVSFNPQDIIQVGKETKLKFKVFDASNGAPISLFATNYEKPAHLVIVDSSLTQFEHIHPNLINKEFTIPFTFNKPGYYHLYLDFLPYGDVEQQFAFTLPVGNNSAPILPSITNDTEFTKQVEDYMVSFKSEGDITSQNLTLGKTKFEFTLSDAQTQQPLTTIQPYLGAFGHLVMIQRETYEYVHVHPTTMSPPKETDVGGPTISFNPIGLNGIIKPGPYILYAQFKHNDNITIATFAIQVNP